MEQSLISNNNRQKIIGLITIGLLMVTGDAMAMTVGSMASKITSNIGALTQLITAGSYIAGIGFAVGAIMKFKAHKDQPTQVPVGTPVALVFIAGALLFLPTILSTAGDTMFGAGAHKTGGATGTVWEDTGS